MWPIRIPYHCGRTVLLFYLGSHLIRRGPPHCGGRSALLSPLIQRESHPESPPSRHPQTLGPGTPSGGHIRALKGLLSTCFSEWWKPRTSWGSWGQMLMGLCFTAVTQIQQIPASHSSGTDVAKGVPALCALLWTGPSILHKLRLKDMCTRFLGLPS